MKTRIYGRICPTSNQENSQAIFVYWVIALVLIIVLESLILLLLNCVSQLQSLINSPTLLSDNNYIELYRPLPSLEFPKSSPRQITTEEVYQEIIRQSKEKKFNVQLALRIADCESDFHYDAKNPSSTATGVYSWTKPTWDFIGATEDRKDHRANIKHFLEWYHKHPGWWECK